MTWLRTVSWVLLAILAVLVLAFSFLSAHIAYRQEFPVGGVSIAEVAAGREAILLGLRGARGTAAGFSAAWAVLLLAVAIGPYRRGDTASWWGILASSLVLGALVALRVPLLGMSAGAGTALVILVLVILALLVDVRRLAGPQ
jgi:hypothetical protein